MPRCAGLALTCPSPCPPLPPPILQHAQSKVKAPWGLVRALFRILYGDHTTLLVGGLGGGVHLANVRHPVAFACPRCLIRLPGPALPVLCRPCPASPWLPTPLPCHAVQPDYTVVPRESETYDIYLVPPGEDPETCQSWLRMRYRDGRYNLMFEEWVVEVRGRCRLWLCSFWPL